MDERPAAFAGDRSSIGIRSRALHSAEAAAGVAPAVFNAIFAATGKRIRSLPLKDQDLNGGA